MVRNIVERNSLKLVGAVDINPRIIGKDVGTVCGLQELGIKVTTPESIFSIDAEVAVITTVSVLPKLLPLLELCIKAGKSVVSTCEELSYPYNTYPELAAKIDALAKTHNVAVLGTGINPGFLMDALPVFMSSVCRNVTSIHVERFQDSRIRRLPFQQKIGAGLALPEWMKLRDAGKIKHVGFSQSLHLIAHAFGWKLDKVEDIVEPVIADVDVSSSLLRVPAGRCCGVRQYGYGYVNGERKIVLEMHAYNGHKEPRDTVHIHGEPEVTSTIVGGVNGDVSTCAIICNCIGSLLAAKPGLATMADIPLPHWCH
eukprot:TRINITY_DN7158_c0_g1_i1.p1 TRINITY_DN7158_c0_g1~~TRINITY_DN7158_c0_g1_i1.p1  ORF type:complete len:366 (+),score=97.00 TRINITY_DN7158_c0_g1_i1:160-1098(+)